MSFAKPILTFVISSLFIISLYLTVNSYTMGNILQKDNFKSFFGSQFTGGLVSSNCEDVCSSQVNPTACANCSYLDPKMQPQCLQSCNDSSQISQAKQMCIDKCIVKTNQSQDQMSDAIDEVYSREIASGVTLNDATNILSNNLLLVILTIILGASLFFVTEKPLSKIGGNIVWVALSILFVAMVPVVVLKSDESVLKMVFDYLFASLYQQAIIGVALLVIGIALLIVGKKIKK
jgi:hypothetical protein